MSAYDTVDREPLWWVRVYCEVPMDELTPIMFSLGDREARRSDGGRDFHVEYLSTDDVIRIATALLEAVKKVKHQIKVDAVLR
jgi:hypothetical protein